MAVETHIYDRQFFQNTIKFEAQSADAFVGIVLRHFNFSSLVDVGCGAGIYLQAFKKQGIRDLLGLDGSPWVREEFLLNKDNLVIFDLCKPYPFGRRHDLALCLEVAEHLPETAADTLVDAVVGAADTVLFSAAIPGQGPRSIGHINEQPHKYWLDKFRKRGFIFQKELTEQLRLELKEAGVVWWIVNNLLILFKKCDK